MKLIPKPLTPEAFSPYGRFVNVYDTDADPAAPLAYYADRLGVHLGQDTVGIGVLHVDPQPAVMTGMEYHEHTEEGWLVLDGDCVAAVGTPAPEPGDGRYEAFYIKKGTAVALKPGVWHFAPIACGEGRTVVLALLPPNTPQDDLIFKELPEPISIA